MARMTVDEFIEKLRLALKKKTLYVMGGFVWKTEEKQLQQYLSMNVQSLKRGKHNERSD